VSLHHPPAFSALLELLIHVAERSELSGILGGLGYVHPSTRLKVAPLE
jgi:hypothetical protein